MHFQGITLKCESSQCVVKQMHVFSGLVLCFWAHPCMSICLHGLDRNSDWIHTSESIIAGSLKLRFILTSNFHILHPLNSSHFLSVLCKPNPQLNLAFINPRFLALFTQTVENLLANLSNDGNQCCFFLCNEQTWTNNNSVKITGHVIKLDPWFSLIWCASWLL